MIKNYSKKFIPFWRRARALLEVLRGTAKEYGFPLPTLLAALSLLDFPAVASSNNRKINTKMDKIFTSIFVSRAKLFQANGGMNFV
jgi:hypothetical protein